MLAVWAAILVHHPGPHLIADRFRLLAEDFTVESGHLTPSLKVRRPQVLRNFTEDVETPYAE